MKKTFIIFLLILIGVFILLSFLDTSDYKIEKQFWGLQKQYAKIAAQTQDVSDQKFTELINRHQQLIEQFPRSSLIPKIYLQIGSIYELKKDYAKARDTFNIILSKFPDNKELAAEALMNVGRMYEKEGKETQAVNTFQWIYTNYPHTQAGLNSPLYLAYHYQNQKDEAKANEMLAQAVTFYKKIAKEQPNSRLEFDSLRLLATSYLALSQWKEAVQILGNILLRSPSSGYLNSQQADLIIKSINTTSISQLKDYNLPIGIYKDFIRQYPRHPLSGYLRQVIRVLENFQKENTANAKAAP